MTKHKPANFTEVKFSIRAFDLDEVEKIITKEHAIEGGKFNPGSRLYGVNPKISGRELTPDVGFNIENALAMLREHIPMDWSDMGLSSGEFEHHGVVRLKDEFEVATSEQLLQMVVDGVMDSIDAYYYFHLKIILWIDDHTDNFMVDMEQTIVALVEYFIVDIYPEMCYSHCPMFLRWLMEASDLEPDNETMIVLKQLATDHFDSWIDPSRKQTLTFAQKAKWEILERELDSSYSSKERTTVQPETNPQGLAIEAEQSQEKISAYSERLQREINRQATRDMHRRMRWLIGLQDLAKSMRADVAQQAACRASAEYLQVSIKLSVRMEHEYLHQLLVFLHDSTATCMQGVREIVFAANTSHPSVEEQMRVILDHSK